VTGLSIECRLQNEKERDMRDTVQAAGIKAILVRLGATPDSGTGRAAVTAKVSRFRLPNGRPVVLEHDRKIPNLWALPEHEKGLLRRLGTIREYQPSEGKHSNLQQTPEFRGRNLLKVAISCPSLPEIEQALRAMALLDPTPLSIRR
jgi:hypothetical protein